VHPHLAGNVRQHLMVVVQPHLEHGVGQRLNNLAFKLYGFFFLRAILP
jgi:hypothetical protein